MIYENFSIDLKKRPISNNATYPSSNTNNTTESNSNDMNFLPSVSSTTSNSVVAADENHTSEFMNTNLDKSKHENKNHSITRLHRTKTALLNNSSTNFGFARSKTLINLTNTANTTASKKNDENLKRVSEPQSTVQLNIKEFSPKFPSLSTSTHNNQSTPPPNTLNSDHVNGSTQENSQETNNQSFFEKFNNRNLNKENLNATKFRPNHKIKVLKSISTNHVKNMPRKEDINKNANKLENDLKLQYKYLMKKLSKEKTFTDNTVKTTRF